MGEETEKEQRGESWATKLNIETFKGDDIVRARKIVDFTGGEWGNLKPKEMKEKSYDKDTYPIEEGSSCPECGSEDIQFDHLGNEGPLDYYLKCNECGKIFEDSLR